MNIFTKPSFYSLPISGILILIVIVVIIKNSNSSNTIDLANWIVILILLSIAISVHGLLHLGLEINYKFNPLE